MATSKIRVGVNGYGVIGKRVVAAVTRQDDMSLVGVSDVVSDWRARMLIRNGFRLFAATSDASSAMREAGLDVSGGLDDLLGQVDVIVVQHDLGGAHADGAQARGAARAGAGDAVAARHRSVGEPRSPRIALIRMGDGLVALNVVKELMADRGRPHDNLYEVALWSDMLRVQDDELFYAYMVDNQAIVIPETIDAIRALTETVRDADASIAKTNAALGIDARLI